MLIIDEAIRWTYGAHLKSKEGVELVRAMLDIWIRLWGPMQYLLSDQEGGLLTNESTPFFSRMCINRLLVGKDGATTKGLVERHIALTKLAMLKLYSAMNKDCMKVDLHMLSQEVCMSQNLLLDYNGGTPQQAFTGQYTTDGWNI